MQLPNVTVRTAITLPLQFFHGTSGTESAEQRPESNPENCSLYLQKRGQVVHTGNVGDDSN